MAHEADGMSKDILFKNSEKQNVTLLMKLYLRHVLALCFFLDCLCSFVFFVLM